MSAGAWRRIGALVVHEASVAAARPRVWATRWVLGAASSAMVLLGAVSNELNRRREIFGGLPESSFDDWMMGIAGIMGSSLYLLTLWHFPFLTLGVLREERRSGRLDLLMASPLTDLQVFAALLGGRFLAAMHVLVGLAPALLALAWMGGLDAILAIAWMLACVIAAASLATSFAAMLAVSGRSEARIWTRLILFIVATPLAFPLILLIAPALLFLSLGVSAAIDSELPLTVLVFLCSAAFPFWTLGLTLREGSFGIWAAVALAVCCPLTFVMALNASRLFPTWVRDRQDDAPREDVAYGKRRTKSGFVAALSGSLRSGPGSAEAALSEDRPPSSYARRRLAGARGVSRYLYSLTGGNPYVAREIIREDSRGEMLGVVVFVLFLLAWNIDEALERNSGAGRTAAALGLLLCGLLAAAQGSQAIPSRRGGADVFLSTTLTGTRILAGSMAAIMIRFRFVFLVLIPIGFVPDPGLDLLRPLAFVLLFGASLAVAHAIGLWTAILAMGSGKRAALSVTVCAALGLGTVTLWPAAAPAHPLDAWSSQQVSAMLGSGSVLAGAALLLGLGFAAAFRRVAARE